MTTPGTLIALHELCDHITVRMHQVFGWELLYSTLMAVTINFKGPGVMQMLLRYALITQHWPNESQGVIVGVKLPLTFSFSSPI